MLFDLLEDYLGWVIVGVVIAGLILILLAANHDSKRYKRLMDQCIADGKKEYECAAMLDDDNNTTYIPVVIPVK